MLCCFTIAHFLGNPSPKSSDPCPSPPHVLSGNTCALLVQTVSESTSHIFNAKSRRYHWKWDMVLNSQELAWSHSAKPQAERFRPAPEAVTHWRSSGVLRGCKGTQHNTCRYLHSQRGPEQGRSAKSPRLPTTQMSWKYVFRTRAECRRPWVGGVSGHT